MGRGEGGGGRERKNFGERECMADRQTDQIIAIWSLCECGNIIENPGLVSQTTEGSEILVWDVIFRVGLGKVYFGIFLDGWFVFFQ